MSRSAASTLPYPELGSETPCTVAAQRVLSDRFALLAQWFPIATDPQNVDVRSVHQLRVATRRISAALAVFEQYCAPKPLRKLKKLLKQMRGAAAQARRDDVHLNFFSSDRRLRSLDAGRSALLESIVSARAAAQSDLNELGTTAAFHDFESLGEAVLDSIADHAQASAGISAAAGQSTPYVLTELAACELPTLVDPIRDLSHDDLNDIEALHDLRLCIKRFRYSLEILGSCFPTDFIRVHYGRIQDAQQRLGSINDLSEIAARVDQVLRNQRNFQKPKSRGDESVDRARTVEQLASIRTEYRERCAAEQEEFRDWWQSAEMRDSIDAFIALLPNERTRPAVARLPRLTHVVIAAETAAETDNAGIANLHDADPHRIAAIDVGSNSVRMVIAATNPESRFRVIEDIRETTRLASGLYSTGRLSQEAMDQAIVVLKQMLENAEHYHVDRLRAIGTSAVREARNGAKFIRRVRDETGIHIEPVSSDYEARLAFASVANAFDLNGMRVAAVDLGGGSVDIVIGENGLIERVVGLPLGAVRLTDRFSDAANPGVYRFEKMEKYIDRALREELTRATPIDI
ncbi:MAG: CHAD domain-containing protein, partial [Phycisphaerae bacterium]